MHCVLVDEYEGVLLFVLLQILSILLRRRYSNMIVFRTQCCEEKDETKGEGKRARD